jgi:hypothetical protein
VWPETSCLPPKKVRGGKHYQILAPDTAVEAKSFICMAIKQRMGAEVTKNCIIMHVGMMFC